MKLISTFILIFGLYSYGSAQDLGFINNPCRIDGPTFFPHPSDEKSFIQCLSATKMIILRCEKDLVWSADISRCINAPKTIKPSSVVQTNKKQMTVPQMTDQNKPSIFRSNPQNSNSVPSTAGRQIDFSSGNIGGFLPDTDLNEVVATLTDSFKNVLNQAGSTNLPDLTNLQNLRGVIDKLIGRSGVQRQFVSIPDIISTTTKAPVITSAICNRVQLTESSLPMINGPYSKLNLSSSNGLPIYKRIDNPMRSGLIVPLLKGWCLTMSFSLFSDDQVTSTFIEENCADLQCCLIFSDISDLKFITSSQRVWMLNALPKSVKRDENIKIQCVDGLMETSMVQSNINQNAQIKIEKDPVVKVSTVNSTLTIKNPSILPAQLTFVPVTECGLIQCPINHSCVTRRNCDTCNPGCNPSGNADDQKVVQVTCLHVKCPTGTLCGKDNRDNLIKCFSV